MSSEHPAAIVTGGAQGLGLAVTELLLKQNYKVCIADVDEKLGQEAVEKLQNKYGKERVMFAYCDVSQESHYKKAFHDVLKEFHRVDVLVNNAGVILEHNPKRAVEINLMGPLYGCQTALKYMGKSNGGNGGFVVNVASLVGIIPQPKAPVYAATKHGVVGLTRSYGKPEHFSKNGVYFAAVCPSFMRTRIITEMKENSDEPGLDVSQRPDILEPLYVAECVLKLLKDKINGSVMLISKHAGVRYVELDQELQEEYKRSSI